MNKDMLGAMSLAPYVHDPYGFVMSQYNWGEGDLKDETGPREWQTRVLKQIGSHLSNPKTRFDPLQIAVASGHGIGKSALMAWLTQWGVTTMVDTRGMITANTENQLRTKTWTEQAVWFQRLACREFFRLEGMSLRGRGREKSWRFDALPWSEGNTEAVQGLHNKNLRLLILVDEASAVHQAVFAALFGALTDENTEIIMVLFGNPTRPNGYFFDCFNSNRAYWHQEQIDSRDVPGTNKSLFKQWETQYGEDSDFFRVRVRGLFPRSASNQLIPYELVTESQGFDVAPRISDPLIFGLDVARYGDDQSVLYPRKGRVAGLHGGPWAWRGLDNVTLARRVVEKILELKPQYVNIDGGGPGGGVVDILRDWGYDVHEVAFGSSASNTDYANKRAEMWGDMREWLRDGGSVPWNDTELGNDLTNQTYSYQLTKHNALILTSKEIMKKDGLPSPDYGDALALTFAIPVYPVTDVSRGLGDARSVSNDYVGGWE